MRNFDEAYFFHKDIQLIDPLVSRSGAQTEVTASVEMKFYPEGGELVTDIPSLIAFEIQGGTEYSTGEILDSSGKVISTFKIVHEGRGSFLLKPEAGEKYYAKLSGSDAQYALPAQRNGGLVLSVSNKAEEVVVSVKSLNTNESNEAYLVAHTRGLVGFASKLEWKGTTAKISIPKEKLAPGVVQITLFNKNWLPEAERLIFKAQNEDLINLQLTTTKSDYSTRDSTTVKIKLQNSQGEPLTGFFSLNAFDTAQISPLAYQESIVSSMLLESDIRGEIQNPSQYFEHDNALASKHLDLLLMTKGWRRFTWKDILNDKFPEIPFEVEQGFTVSGRVMQRGNKKPVAKGLVKQIGNFGGLPSFSEATTKGNGEFELKNLLYYEQVGLVQAEDKKGKTNVVLNLDSIKMSPFVKRVEIPTRRGWEMISVAEEYIQRSLERISIDSAYSFENSTDLGTVVVEGTKNDVIFSNASRGLVFNRGEYGLDVSDIMSNGQKFINALYVLQGRIPGFSITSGASPGEPFVQMTRKVWSLQNPDPPILYFIDDAPADLSAITSMPAERIQRVEVLKGMRATGIYGPSANGGAIAFYTKTGDEYDAFYKKLTENNVITSKNVLGLEGGFYQSREFYAPNYGTERPEHIKPDRRDLIHWEPFLQTNEKGEAEVTFYNADLPTTIQINVEGIWEGGIPLATSTQYKVKRK